jgi:hypothetical protein
MHKFLTILGIAGTAATLALTPALLAAQDAAPDPAPAPEAATPAPDAADPRLAALTAEQQAAIKAWPAETRDYYFSLTQERQKIFWALSDSDKVALSRMPDQQRESAWAQIEARTKPPRA